MQTTGLEENVFYSSFICFMYKPTIQFFIVSSSLSSLCLYRCFCLFWALSLCVSFCLCLSLFLCLCPSLCLCLSVSLSCWDEVSYSCMLHRLFTTQLPPQLLYVFYFWDKISLNLASDPRASASWVARIIGLKKQIQAELNPLSFFQQNFLQLPVSVMSLTLICLQEWRPVSWKYNFLLKSIII